MITADRKGQIILRKYHRRRKAKIIFITQLYPFPPKMGGTLRSYGTIRALLSKGHEIYLVAFSDSSEDQSIPKQICPFKKTNFRPHLIRTNIINDLHRWRNFLLYVKSNLLFTPFRAIKYSSEVAMKIMGNIQSEINPDIIYFDHFSSAIYLPFVKNRLPQAKIILDVHDIESKLSFEKFKTEKSPFLKMVYLIESIKSIFFERNILKSLDRIFVMSSEAKSSLEKKTNSPISIIPISIFENIYKNRISERTYNHKNKNVVTFIGTLSLDVNKNGLKWFIDCVWDLIKEQVPDATLIIIGSYGRIDINHSLLKKGIVFKGYQKTLKRAYANTTVGIVPMLTGGTIRMKTLGFLARGIPFVSTIEGVHGIPEIKNGIHCYIANSPIQFSNSIIELLKNQSLRHKFSLNSVSLFKKYYGFPKLVKFLDSEFTKTISLPPRYYNSAKNEK